MTRRIHRMPFRDVVEPVRGGEVSPRLYKNKSTTAFGVLWRTVEEPVFERVRGNVYQPVHAALRGAR